MRSNKIIKNNFNLILLGVIVLLLFFIIKDKFMNSDGRLYSTRETMCTEFAQSYLKNNNNFVSNSDIWAKVVDIETDIYNLCMINPQNMQDLQKFDSHIYSKYKTK